MKGGCFSQEKATSGIADREAARGRAYNIYLKPSFVAELQCIALDALNAKRGSVMQHL